MNYIYLYLYISEIDLKAVKTFYFKKKIRGYVFFCFEFIKNVSIDFFCLYKFNSLNKK